MELANVTLAVKWVIWQEIALLVAVAMVEPLVKSATHAVKLVTWQETATLVVTVNLVSKIKANPKVVPPRVVKNATTAVNSVISPETAVPHKPHKLVMLATTAVREVIWLGNAELLKEINQMLVPLLVVMNATTVVNLVT